jgi:hypothetical protein
VQAGVARRQDGAAVRRNYRHMSGVVAACAAWASKQRGEADHSASGGGGGGEWQAPPTPQRLIDTGRASDLAKRGLLMKALVPPMDLIAAQQQQQQRAGGQVSQIG